MAQQITREMVDNLSLLLDTYSDMQLTSALTVVIDQLYVIDPFTMEYRNYGSGAVHQNFFDDIGEGPYSPEAYEDRRYDAYVAYCEAAVKVDEALAFNEIFDGTPETP